jgi:hypothetical protein
MPADGTFAEKNQRLTYLLDLYKLYQTHINTMFNYFLLVSGLLANAYIQILQKQAILGGGVAGFGVLMSVMALLVHIRSREILDGIEAGLRIKERDLFAADSPGFITGRSKHWWWHRRHRYQFRFIYGSVAVAFLIMAVYALMQPHPDIAVSAFSVGGSVRDPTGS